MPQSMKHVKRNFEFCQGVFSVNLLYWRIPRFGLRFSYLHSRFLQHNHPHHDNDTVMSSGSFAAAQQRIQARQEARRQEAQSAQLAIQQSISASSLSRLPFPFNRAAGPLNSFWNILLSNDGTNPSLRVGQVDAELLDEELLTLLRSQISDALKYFNPSVQDAYSREITLALRTILFKLSIWDNDASYGAFLQGLRYTDARRSNSASLELAKPTKLQKTLYGLITVLGHYGWDKLNDHIINLESSYDAPPETYQSLSNFTSRLSTFHNTASFFSFAIFLLNGRYRTLTDRILRMRLVSPTANTRREVSFEYLNRQLVWHAFTEFLLFLLPLVGISRWRRILSRTWRRAKSAFSADPGAEAQETKKGPLSFLPERTCAICYETANPSSTSEAEVLGANTAAGGGIIGSVTTDIVNAYETIPCACIYCFSCIASKIESEEGGGWTCLRCGEVVQKCRPWRGDVLVTPPKKEGNRKNVGFAEEGDGEDQEERNGLDRENAEIIDAEEDDGDDDDDDDAAPGRIDSHVLDGDLDSELGGRQWEWSFERRENRDLVT